MVIRLAALFLIAFQVGAAAVWRAESKPLFTQGPAGAFDDVSVKDPSVVRRGGKWHLFYTAIGSPQEPPSIAYAAAETLSGLETAERHHLNQLAGEKTPYAAAPQVFFFEPQGKWYMIYQTHDHPDLQPVYSTTATIGDPSSWAEPAELVRRDEDTRWIDFWVICDEEYAYLFYSRTQRDVYMRKTRIEDFPSGWGPHRHVFDAPIKEAVHVYKVSGREEYNLFYEAGSHPDQTRYFGQAWAPSLNGPWTHVTETYAAGDQLDFQGGRAWTEVVSHGEALRSGYNQRLEYEEDARWLIQGLRKEDYSGPYNRLPWVLGLIEPVRKALPSGIDPRSLNQAAFIDPNYGGSADPEIVWNPHEKEWWIFYTGRRSKVPGTAVGCPIGVAASADGENWEFRGYCKFDGVGGVMDSPEHNYWAPGIIRDGGSFHMFVTYGEKNTGDWGGGDHGIMHYQAPVTDALNGWKKAGWVEPAKNARVIDAGLASVSGEWRMWTKYRAQTGLFTSEDLTTWKDSGVLEDQPQNEFHNVEGPYVFRWKGAWWMVTDPHNGIQVYRSGDAANWEHNSTILLEPGARMLDQARGRHPSVAVVQGRAFIVYHVEPFRPYPKMVPMPRLPPNMKRVVIQIAELELDSSGKVTCNRNRPAVLPLPE